MFRTLSLIVAISVLGFMSAMAQPRPPDGFIRVPGRGEDVNCAACLVKSDPSPPPIFSSHDFTGFGWPFKMPLEDGLVLVNYVDDDPTNNVRDYMGLPHAYNGHRGTDVTLYTFRDMDHGVPFYTAAPGIVLGTVFHHGDRNIGPPYPDSGNGIWIQHDDGFVTYYWHPRKNSVVVEPGEVVEEGQFLALAGSSGFSTDPHLHFEVQENLGNTTVFRDPWNGTFNPRPSLWKDQPDYVGDDSLRIYDIGITTGSAVGGDLNDVDGRDFRERMSQPDTFGIEEPQIAVWFLLQGQAAETYTVELIKPDSTIFAEATYDLTGKSRFDFHYWYWNLVGVSESDFGEWKTLVATRGRTIETLAFNVGQETVFGPRFAIAGKSIRLEDESVTDTLRMSPLGDKVQFHLIDAPENVSLVDSIVTVSYPSFQPFRSLFFDVVAVDPVGRTDTMKYHVVDPSRPLDPKPVGIETSMPRAIRTTTFDVFPNPATSRTNIQLDVDRPQILTVEVFDVLGRRARPNLTAAVGAGLQRIPLQTASLSAGTYLLRLVGEETHATRALIVVTP